MPNAARNLFDLADIPGADIMARAAQVDAFRNDPANSHLALWRRASLTGSGPTVETIDPFTGERREMILLSSNDYLNLSRHPRLIEAAADAVRKFGTGSGASPLMGGVNELQLLLEKEMAEFKSCEATILHTSGFVSNMSTILSLLNRKDLAIIDQLSHASIEDGCKNTRLAMFRHNDMAHLEEILIAARAKYRTRLIAVDGVYSMDGDIAPLDKIVELARQYGAYVLVDDAHATGVIGKHGRGTAEHFGLGGKVDIVVGTMSKGVGSIGGFVCSSREMISLLFCFSRGYIFSTAPSPADTGAQREAIKVIVDEPQHRARLWDNINYFKKNLLALGFDIGRSETAIFPIIIGDDEKTKAIAMRMHELGLLANPIFFPVVPSNQSRVRISLMAAHTQKHLDQTLEVLERLGKQYGVI